MRTCSWRGVVNQEAVMELALSAICERVHGELVGDGTTRITGISVANDAHAGHLTLAEDAPHLAQALASEASAILVTTTASNLQGRPCIRLTNPKLAFAYLLAYFYPEATPVSGVHSSAVLGADVHLGAGVAVGAHAVIEDGVTIGAGTRVGAGAYLGHGVTLGEDCMLDPNVTLYRRTCLGDRVIVHSGSVIGGDGFGYVFHDGAYHKIPQTGTVVIENDVEIGCNVCIDRSTVGSTVVREGTKIDNLVQVAHNNTIGRHVALAGQVGLAGSVTVEDYVRLGGKVGVTDHLTIGRGVDAGAGTLVIKSIAPGTTIWGVPARPARETWQRLALLSRLPALLKRWLRIEGRVDMQERRLGKLERQLHALIHPKQGEPNRQAAVPGNGKP